MPGCLVGLGANLGPRRLTLERAVAALAAEPGIALVAQSRWHETAPIGGPPGQANFLNGAVRLDVSLAPQALAGVLQRIEAEAGRKRAERWSARTLDLDLLLYDNLVLESEELTIPHPRMAFRRFVLEGAAEVAADMVHPRIGWTISRLLAHLETAVPYVAVTGLPDGGPARLAETLAEHLGGTLIRDPERLLPHDPPADDSSGPALELAIKWVTERAEPLRAADWPTPKALAASDFWFDDCMAWMAACLVERDRAAIEKHWQGLRHDVVPPKLVVVLSGAERAPPGWSEAQRRQFEAELALRLDRPDVGPVLSVPTADPAAALAEVAAAVQAMQ